MQVSANGGLFLVLFTPSWPVRLQHLTFTNANSKLKETDP